MRTLLIAILLTTICAMPRVSSAIQDEAEGGPRVARAELCTAIVDREPEGSAESFSSDTPQLWCFTELRDASGETIVHAWIHDGTTRARVELKVRSDRWRTWSSKRILPSWTGAWQVKVMTAEGVVLETINFTVE